MTAPTTPAAFPAAGGNFNGGPGGFQPPGGENGQGSPAGALAGALAGPALHSREPITALDGDSLTIEIADGSTVTVNYPTTPAMRRKRAQARTTSMQVMPSAF
jgi:outer membrane lipoprotein SlyB